MKTYKIIFFFFSISLFFTGCKEYLDLEPNSTIGVNDFYSNKTEAEIALSGIYSIFANDAVYGRDMSIAMEAGTDEGYYNRRFNENWTVGLYRHTSADSYVFDLWTNLYEAINLSNLFNEKLQKDAFEEAEYNRLLAEALFLRAHAYALLVNWYEEVPMPLTSTQDQSANNLAVSSLEIVYEQIIKDFTFASEHLVNVGDPNYVQGRATKTAAQGLLARVYLKMAGFPLNDKTKFALAKLECEKVINSGVHSLNLSTSSTITDPATNDTRIVVTVDGYRNHFLNYIKGTYDINESIFEISFKYLRDQGLFTDGRIGEANGLNFNFGGGQPGFPFAFAGYSPSPLLENSYETANDSIRKTWNLPAFEYRNDGNIRRVENELSPNFAPGKFRRWEPADLADLDRDVVPGSQQAYVILEQGPIFKNFTNINFPVLRYSDVLLMYAEADNEVNGMPSSLAVQYLNNVRNRAGLEPIGIAKPSAIASKENFFKEIVEERFREFAFEALRKHDLIRWGLLGERLKLLEQSIIGHPNYSPTNANHDAFLKASRFFDPSKHLSLPYPLQEVQLNNALEQKPNW